MIAAGNDALFVRLCPAPGPPGLASDRQFATNAARCEIVYLLKRLIEDATLEKPAFMAAGNPVKMTGLADSPPRHAAPGLDGDRRAILDWLDRAP